MIKYQQNSIQIFKYIKVLIIQNLLFSFKIQQLLQIQAKEALIVTFKHIKEHIKEQTYEILITPQIIYSTRPGSHFTLNNALSALKLLKQIDQDHQDLISNFKSPADISKMIVQNWQENNNFQIVCAGPFINITVKSHFLYNLAKNMYLIDQNLPPSPQYDKYERIAIDFSSPNIAKDMHVGHICSTVIGDCICRLFEYLQGKLESKQIDAIKGQILDGVEGDMIEKTCRYSTEQEGKAVFRLNHVGDWGTQFGMLITYIQTEGGKKLEELANKYEVPYEPIENVEDGNFQTVDISDLVAFYKKSRVLFDTNATFKKLSQLAVVRLQSQQKQEIEIWQNIVSESRKTFNKIYEQLNIKLIEQGESFYNDKLQQAVDDCVQAGLISDSNGGKILDFHSKLLPLIVQKSDGGFGYDSTDLACIKYRLQYLKADRLIYITDLGQETHFFSVFEAAKLLHYPIKENTLVQHCGFGVVCGADGKRLKTRSGATVKLQDLLDEGYEKSWKIVSENQTLSQCSEEEKQKIAKKISISAIKYAFLTNNRVKDMKFDLDKVLSFKGNTACYMLYSYARICSIIRKIVEQKGQSIMDEIYNYYNEEEKFEPAEQQLMYTIMKKDSIILQMTETLQPYQLCDWMYQIALDFTSFYEKCRVINNGEVNMRRLQICEMSRKALLLSFKLLGLEEVERM